MQLDTKSGDTLRNPGYSVREVEYNGPLRPEYSEENWPGQEKQRWLDT